MTSTARSHLLTFLLPPGADRAAVARAPIAFDCIVEGGKAGLVSILGRSREAVFSQAALVLLEAYKGPPATIAANLYSARDEDLSDGRDWINVRNQVDRWTIIVNASVAFAPTALDAFIPGNQGVMPIATAAAGV